MNVEYLRAVARGLSQVWTGFDEGSPEFTIHNFFIQPAREDQDMCYKGDRSMQ